MIFRLAENMPSPWEECSHPLRSWCLRLRQRAWNSTDNGRMLSKIARERNKLSCWRWLDEGVLGAAHILMVPLGPRLVFRTSCRPLAALMFMCKAADLLRTCAFGFNTRKDIFETSRQRSWTIPRGRAWSELPGSGAGEVKKNPKVEVENKTGKEQSRL